MTSWEYKTVKLEAEGWLGGVANTEKITQLLNGTASGAGSWSRRSTRT